MDQYSITRIVRALSICAQQQAFASNRSLIVVANEGLWFAGSQGYGPHTQSKARSKARTLARDWLQLRQQFPHIHLVWRETSPQNFAESLSGAYPGQVDRRQGWKQPSKHGACKLHADVESPWEAPVNQPLEAAGIPVVHIWNATRPHWDKHLSNRTPYMRGRVDCTHFCMGTEGGDVLDMWVQLLLPVVQQLPRAQR